MKSHANIITETRKLLTAIEEERKVHLNLMDRLVAIVMEAVEAEALGKPQADVRVACKVLLDAAYETLGECEPAELLCALLGYEETDEEALS
jgi:hypothetical protein